MAQWLKNLTMDRLLPGLALVVAGILVIRFTRKITERALRKSKLEPAAHSMIQSVLTVVLCVLFGLMIASQLGIDVTGVVALASVVSLAISLSLQDALGNLIGGFTLLTAHPFKAGDYVEAAGQAGVVTNIDMIYTHLHTPDGKLVSIPNSTMVSTQIVNYATTGARRVDITVSASYDAAVDQVLEALLRAAAVPSANPDSSPFAAVQNYGDSAISYILQIWTTPDAYWTTLWDVNKRIKEEFDASGIEMTYPHLNVHLDR